MPLFTCFSYVISVGQIQASLWERRKLDGEYIERILTVFPGKFRLDSQHGSNFLLLKKIRFSSSIFLVGFSHILLFSLEMRTLLAHSPARLRCGNHLPWVSVIFHELHRDVVNEL